MDEGSVNERSEAPEAKGVQNQQRTVRPYRCSLFHVDLLREKLERHFRDLAEKSQQVKNQGSTGSHLCKIDEIFGDDLLIGKKELAK